MWSILHDYVSAFKLNEGLEPVDKICVSTDEATDSVNKNVAIDEVLRKEVAELEELIHNLLISDVLLDPVKEGKLFWCCSRCGGWW